MDDFRIREEQRRNRNFAETHRQLVERAAHLIGRDGVEALSVASLARDAGMNRSTVYYHFESREVLLSETKQWVSHQLSDVLLGDDDPAHRLAHVVSFVLTHPEVVSLWISDLVAGGPIRTHFPYWDLLLDALHQGPEIVGALGGHYDEAMPETEVWASMTLAAALVGPRLYKNSVHPEEDAELIADRFHTAYDWLLKELRHEHAAA